MADTLRNDHLETLRDYFCQLYRDQTLCDVSLITKYGTTILAHKLIMSAFSGAVRTEVERWKDLPQVSIMVDCDDTVLRGIIEFIYTGSLNIDEELLPLIYDACHGLQIPLLLKYIDEKMKEGQKTDEVDEEKVERRKKKIYVDNHNILINDVDKEKIERGKKNNVVMVVENHGILNDRQKITKRDSKISKKITIEKREKAGKKIIIVREQKEVNTESVNGNELGRKIKEKPCPRSKRNITSKTVEEEDEFDWLDDENDEIIDDTTDDETWQPSEKIDQEESDEDENVGRKDLRMMKNAVVRLERIDSGLDFRTDKTKLIKFTSPKEEFTRLKNVDKPKYIKKYPKFDLKTVPRRVRNKIRHTVKLYIKQKLLQKTAKKIVKCYKKINCIQKQKLGYSCKLCEFWTKSYSQALLHVHHKCKYSSSKKSVKKSSRKKIMLKSNSNSMSKRERKKRQKRIERSKEKIQNLQCFRCSRKFKSIRSLAVHLREKHGYTGEKVQKMTGYPKYFVTAEKMDLRCDACSLNFDRLMDYRDHCRVVHKKKRLDADIPCSQDGCIQKFFLLKDMKDHLANDHNWNKKECKNLRFRDKQIKKSSNYMKKQNQILKEFSATEQNSTKELTSGRHQRKKKDCSSSDYIKRRELSLNECSAPEQVSVKTLRSIRHWLKENKSGKMNLPVKKGQNTNGKNQTFKGQNSNGKKSKSKIFIPTSTYKCDDCVNERTFHCRHLRDCHIEVVHGKQFISSQFLSCLAIRKSMVYRNPATCMGFRPVKNKEGFEIDSSLNQISEKVADQLALTQTTGKVANQSELNQPFENVMEQSDLNQLGEKVTDQSEIKNPSCMFSILDDDGIKEEKDLTSAQPTNVFQDLMSENFLSSCSDLANGVNTVPQSDEIRIDTLLGHIKANNDFSLVEPSVSTGLHQQSKEHESQTCSNFPFTCRKCGTSFRYFSLLSKHFDRKHRKLQIKQRSIYLKIRKYSSTRKLIYLKEKKKIPDKKTNFTCEKLNSDCSICGKTFKETRYLASHLTCYHKFSFAEAREESGYPLYSNKDIVGAKVVKCIVCANSFTQVRQLALHLQSKHRYSFEKAREATGYPSFRNAFKPPCKTVCPKCSETLPSKKAMRRHLREEHGIKCLYCKESYASNLSYKRHGMKHHPEHIKVFQQIQLKPLHDEEKETFHCESCDYSSTSVKTFKTHVIDNHPDVLHSCQLCSFSFRHKTLLERHVEKFHGEQEKEKTACRMCKKKFVKMCYLRVHEFKKHGIPHRSLKEFHCDFEGCNKIFYTKYNIQAHKRNHQRQKNLQCTECEWVFTTKSNLRRHFQSVHQQRRPHLCETCGKSFTTAAHLNNHYKRFHTDEYYTVQCEYCVYQCGTKHDLHSHIFHQHGIKPEDDKRYYYQCEKCSYQTPLKRKFTNHMNSHNNIRNYVCGICNQTFITKETLDSHMKWKHSTEEKTCPHCRYVTKTTQKLNEHIRIQHQLKGIKPYHCTYCPFTCATSQNCRKHIMGRHKGREVKYTCDREYLEVAKKARKEGNTKQLVFIETKVESEEDIN